MFIVCFLNFVKACVIAVIWVLRQWQASRRKDAQKQVLYTLGDAIASFMRHPEPDD
jgi:hypothetical protein